MIALMMWQLLIIMVAIKLCITTNLDLELRLGPSHNQEEEEVLTQPQSDTMPTSEQQQHNPTIENIVGLKRKRKVHRTQIPLLKAAKEQENKQLTEAEMQKQKKISDASSKRRLQRQHEKLLGKQPTEAEKQKHRENMKKYREKVVADPVLAAEYRRRISAHKIARKEQAKNDPIEAAWQKKLRQRQNKAYREKKKLEKQKAKSQINQSQP